MDLTLTRRGDYVVRAALSLARAWPLGEARKIREVSSEMDLPRTYTPQILAMLAKAGLADAKAGRNGGYRLLRSPETITLLEVVEAGEGPLAPERCTLRGGPCHWDDVCALHPAWGDATQALRGALGTVTLASVANVDEQLERGAFKLPIDAHRHAQKRTVGQMASRGLRRSDLARGQVQGPG